MEGNIILQIGLVVIGIIAGGLSVTLIKKNKAKDVILKAKQEGENIKKEKILQAKEKFIELKSLHEKTILEREKNISQLENTINKKEQQINVELNKVNQSKKNIEEIKSAFEKKSTSLDKFKKEIEDKQASYTQKLESLSGLSVNEAKNELVETLKEKAKLEASAYIQRAQEETRIVAQEEAKKIIIGAIQRIGVEEAIENSVSIFNLSDDALKGRIIGREGRNIRSLENATGVDINIDDTPEAIVISSFDPVRREIARLSLQRLVLDGRIHPTRIEEVVKKVEKQLDNEIIETGKKTVIDLGIHGLHPELIKIVGRMKYRSSYGQNLLHHSKEVARLCGVMASEVGLNPKLAKRAGLLHDIGKVPSEETETPHALLGMQWAEKYNEKPEVCNAIGAHHDEIEMTTLLSPIVQVCDGISGARPGARRKTLDDYIQRLKDMEDIAYEYNGVNKAYAIQAGRELRVMVESDKISDDEATKISFDISQKIQSEMTYPGQVKVTVVRETRAINIAK